MPKHFIQTYVSLNVGQLRSDSSEIPRLWPTQPLGGHSAGLGSCSASYPWQRESAAITAATPRAAGLLREEITGYLGSRELSESLICFYRVGLQSPSWDSRARNGKAETILWHPKNQHWGCLQTQNSALHFVTVRRNIFTHEVVGNVLQQSEMCLLLSDWACQGCHGFIRSKEWHF